MTERTYVVKEGDTLCSIAKEVLGKASRYVELVQWNRLRVATLASGEVLRIEGE